MILISARCSLAYNYRYDSLAVIRSKDSKTAKLFYLVAIKISHTGQLKNLICISNWKQPVPAGIRYENELSLEDSPNLALGTWVFKTKSILLSVIFS